MVISEPRVRLYDFPLRSCSARFTMDAALTGSGGDLREWRNGSRTWLRTKRRKKHEGSNPSSRTDKRKWRNGRRSGLKNRPQGCGFNSRLPHQKPGSEMSGTPPVLRAAWASGEMEATPA
jgi:hypothetical protein